MAFGPQGFDTLLACSPPPCFNVSIEFSLLDPGAPQVVFTGVRANETVQAMRDATAAMLDVPITEVGLLYGNSTCPNPRTPLSALAVEGCVQLQVFPGVLCTQRLELGDRACGLAATDVAPPLAINHDRHKTNVLYRGPAQRAERDAARYH